MTDRNEAHQGEQELTLVFLFEVDHATLNGLEGALAFFGGCLDHAYILNEERGDCKPRGFEKEEKERTAAQAPRVRLDSRSRVGVTFEVSGVLSSSGSCVYDNRKARRLQA